MAVAGTLAGQEMAVVALEESPSVVVGMEVRRMVELDLAKQLLAVNAHISNE